MNTNVPEQVLEALLPEPSIYPETTPIHFLAMQKAGVKIIEEDDSFTNDPLQYLYCHVIFKMQGKDLLAIVKKGKEALSAYLDDAVLKITFPEQSDIPDNIRSQVVKTFSPSLPFDSGNDTVKKNIGA